MAEGRRRPRILVTHDDRATGDMIAATLERDSSPEVFRARGPEEAIDLFALEAPDMIVCGLRESVEWTHRRRLTAKEDEKDFPLLLLVSDSTEIEKVGALLGRGVDDYVEKRLCPYLLRPKVRSMIHGRWSQEDLQADEDRLQEAKMLLEKSSGEMTSALLKILEVRVPGATRPGPGREEDRDVRCEQAGPARGKAGQSRIGRAFARNRQGRPAGHRLGQAL